MTIKRLKSCEDVDQHEFLKTEEEYRRLNNQIRKETRSAVKSKEKDIAKHVQDNPKIFWKYVQSKTTNKPRIPELYKNCDKLIKTNGDLEKAEVLGEQFSGVFVHEPEGEIPRCTMRNVPTLQHFEVKEDDIRKIIQKLKRHKSPGPDNLHPKIIKEATDVLLEPLKILYEYSFNTISNFQTTGVQQISRQFTRKVQNVIQKTIVMTLSSP
ncbi:hypothetical protein Pmani_003391 [Petrolisthes manimaculis]|uniref:Uncharacterized protein n=1 Tax=Petrolisthes manimaculis TaxID=1843537 RepID=A0AAE1UPE1_9EUCA|nr:hypothetical protein Pmani_003391 [Petrolisthes manimaculis]